MNGDALVKKTTKIMFGDAGISGTAQYMSQLVWILFLKVFDYKEEEWELEGSYTPVIPTPFRFRDWADLRKVDGTKDYANRLTGDKLINFVNNRLFPYLSGKEIKANENDNRKNAPAILFASEDSKAAIVRSFMAESQNYMKDGVRLRQLINEIGDIDFDVASEKHDFNDFYERLLKELQNGGKATGEFYTPRAITSFIVDHVNPKIGERVADFACGTGGFLADAISHLQKQATSLDDALKIQKSVYGIEWKQLPYMLCVTNMYLHNIDNPRIVHGDGLAKDILALDDSDLFDCVVMNPPFGGEFNKADLKNYPDDISSSESADLFVARIIYCLKKNGRCGLVLPDGLLFNSDQSKVNLKKLLMTECNLHTVIRLPGSVFAPYTSINTNLLFFEKTGKTKEVWFYRMDMPQGRKHFNKTHPIARDDMKAIDEWWHDRHEIKDEKDDPAMTETWKSKKYTYKEIADNGFNLDLCGFPEEEEIILSPEETIKNFKEKRENLEAKLDEKLFGLSCVLDGNSESAFNMNGFLETEKQLVELHNVFPNDMRKSILQYAMQGKLVEQRPEEGTGEELYRQIQAEKGKLIKEGKIKKEKALAEITENEIPFDIPESWKWVRLGEVGDWGAGCTPPRTKHEYYGGSIPWLKTGDLNDGFIDQLPESITEKALKETSLRLNPIGSILMAMYGATIGKLGILRIKATTNQACCACIPYNGLYNKYLFYYLLSARREFIKKGAGGAQSNISRDKIVKYPIPLPPIKEQKRIARKLEQILPHFNDIKEAI